MKIFSSRLAQPINRWKTNLSNPVKKFGAASESELIIFGARRPGFPFYRVPPAIVENWITFMQAQNVKRVLCLLPPEQLAYYPASPALLESYRDAFGINQVCWTPIKDFHLADEQQLLTQILPFLAQADQLQEKTVVHCSGGIGRTGHVLAASLVAFRGLTNTQAIETVKRQGRNAQEARNKNLETLLDLARATFSKTGA